jgi:glycosyltransferase involved in cell wall biosynthesis
VRIGIVNTNWPPRYGGGAQYCYRLALALARAGLDVHAFCGTPEDPARANGEFPVTRWCPDGIVEFQSWHWAYTAKAGPGAEFFRPYEFMDAAASWARSLELEVVLVNQMLARVEFHQTRELVLALKARGMKVGIIHHDIGSNVRHHLESAYRDSRDWQRAADPLLHHLAERLNGRERLATYYVMGSPMFFAPDFVVSCSHWSDRFLDPSGSARSIVLHPLMDADFWRQPIELPPDVAPVDVLMVNPLPHKGADIMADLVANGAPRLRYRVLQGDWGRSFERFAPMIANAAATLEKRVDLREYLPDMRAAYRAARVVSFPSFYEGYGMTAVEALYAGTPVVAGNYPAILEGVGDAALTLCPHVGAKVAWRAAIDEVLRNPEEWQARGRARVDALERRQALEVDALVAFLAVCK